MFHLAECYRRAEIGHRRAARARGDRRVRAGHRRRVLERRGQCRGAWACRPTCGAQTTAFERQLVDSAGRGAVHARRLGRAAGTGATGALTAQGGVSFAPAFAEQGRWVRMADLSARGTKRPGACSSFTSAAGCAAPWLTAPKRVTAARLSARSSPLTPDGVFSELRKTSPGVLPWGVTWPVLGKRRYPRSPHRMAMPSPPPGIRAVRTGRTSWRWMPRPRLDFEPATLRGTYGDLRPVRVTRAGYQ